MFTIKIEDGRESEQILYTFCNLKSGMVFIIQFKTVRFKLSSQQESMIYSCFSV